MLSGRPSPLSITSDTLTLSRNMSAPAANLHSKRLPSAEQERAQARPELDAAQHLLLRDRQRFFEEVFQHDVDVYLSSTHLSIRDYKRTPIGSVSSMEVNVDLLDQMELIDLSDQEGLDVFYSSAGEDGALTSPRPGNSSSEEPLSKGLLRRVLERPEGKSRVSSTSSDSSCDSQSTDVARGDTPLLGSDTEETQSGSVHRTAPSAEREERSLSS